MTYFPGDFFSLNVTIFPVTSFLVTFFSSLVGSSLTLACIEESLYTRVVNGTTNELNNRMIAALRIRCVATQQSFRYLFGRLLFRLHLLYIGALWFVSYNNTTILIRVIL